MALGRNWIQALKINLTGSICQVVMDALLEKYQEIFQEGLGLLWGYKAKIHIDPNATPKYFKAHLVPYLLKAKIEEQLEKLVKEGVMEPIQYSECDGQLP